MTKGPMTRREFVQRTGVAAGLLGGLGHAQAPAGGNRGAGMRRVSKEVFVPTQNDTGVFPGFITYIHKSDPVLLHRFGWVDASDTYDNFHDQISEDNGRTWSAPVLKLTSRAVEGGRLRYVENGAYFDADTGKLITVVSKIFYPNDHFSKDEPRQLEFCVYDPQAGEAPEPFTTDFGLPGGMGCSFCFPIKTATGRIVIPGFKAQVGEDGRFHDHPKSRTTVYEVRMVIGEHQPDGAIDWHVGQPILPDDERTTRGFSESTPVELRDGRLATLCRGSNAGAPELPGYKWLSFSEDHGETWSEAVPFACDDGEPIESSATGAACFRSIKTGKLYYVGNLCARGERANGNWPRSPLYIAEVQEEPFALKRDTITVIDERGPDDSPKTQISNFRYYQDRETGDVVLFATRFGERDAKHWKRADYYRYRVAIA